MATRMIVDSDGTIFKPISHPDNGSGWHFPGDRPITGADIDRSIRRLGKDQGLPVLVLKTGKVPARKLLALAAGFTAVGFVLGAVLAITII